MKTPPAGRTPGGESKRTAKETRPRCAKVTSASALKTQRGRIGDLIFSPEKAGKAEKAEVSQTDRWTWRSGSLVLVVSFLCFLR